MQAKGVFGMVSRESALVVNNILLAVAALVVFVGTIWPLVAEMAWGRKLSVGAPFFEKAFTPFMLLLVIVLPIGALMPWKRAGLARAVQPLIPAMVLALSVAALTWAIGTNRSAIALVGAGLGSWLIFGALTELWVRSGRKAARITRLPRADWGKALAHGGLGVTFIGIALLTAWDSEDIRVAKIGEPFTVAGYEITLDGVEEVQGPNYTSTVGTMSVRENGKLTAVMHPEKRVYPVQAMPTTEAAIDQRFTGDVYLVIGDPQLGGGFAVRTYIKPFADWIWTGLALMALGGMLSLSDRRYRVAAGARKRAPLAATPAE